MMAAIDAIEGSVQRGQPAPSAAWLVTAVRPLRTGSVLPVRHDDLEALRRRVDAARLRQLLRQGR